MPIAWTRDEIILGLDVMLTSEEKSLSNNSQLIIELSDLLKKLPIHIGSHDDRNFRNPNGVSQQLSRLRYSIIHSSNRQNINSDFYIVLKEYENNYSLLHKTANAIKDLALNDVDFSFGNKNEILGFREGAIISHYHRHLEQNYCQKHQPKNRKCYVCGTDYSSIYLINEGVKLETHLLVPPEKLCTEVVISESDIIEVCPNCHKALHEFRPWCTKGNLKNILRDSRCENV